MKRCAYILAMFWCWAAFALTSDDLLLLRQAAAGASIPALPQGITNAVLMEMRAGSITGLASGEYVTIWRDQTSFGRSWTNGDTATAPTYNSTGFNGYPCVDFGTSNRYLTIVITNTTSAAWLTTNHTVIATLIFKKDQSATSGNTNGNLYVLHRYATDTSPYYGNLLFGGNISGTIGGESMMYYPSPAFGPSSLQAYASNTIGAATATVFAIRTTGAVAPVHPTVTYINGQWDGSGYGANNATMGDLRGYFRMGASAQNTAFAMRDFIVYHGTLTTNEVESVAAVLRSASGL